MLGGKYNTQEERNASGPKSRQKTEALRPLRVERVGKTSRPQDNENLDNCCSFSD